MSESTSHLGATDLFETEHPRIRALVAEPLAAATDVHDLARRVFELARDVVPYSVFVPFQLREHYRASATLERGRGYCVQKAILLVTLARAAAIGARLVFADLRNHGAPAHLREILAGNLFVYHSYATLRVNGQWLDATPAFDRELCETNDLPLVRFDGHSSAVYPAVDSAGRPYAEYVQHHGVFDDLPLAAMMAAWEQTYGADRLARWNRLTAAMEWME